MASSDSHRPIDPEIWRIGNALLSTNINCLSIFLFLPFLLCVSGKIRRVHSGSITSITITDPRRDLVQGHRHSKRIHRIPASQRFDRIFSGGTTVNSTMSHTSICCFYFCFLFLSSFFPNHLVFFVQKNRSFIKTVILPIA